MEEETSKQINQKIGLSDGVHAVLEAYWIESNEEETTNWSYEADKNNPIYKELILNNIATEENGRLILTNHGRIEARSYVRRRRLAEMLFWDVLETCDKKTHEMGCQHDYLLQKEVTENICTLLGHPTSCPHDQPIPEGDCCSDTKRMPNKLVRNLSECELGETGLITYLKTDEDSTLNKLTSMGVLPGLKITLLKKRPGFLFQMGQSQFVVDRELASKIQVKTCNKKNGKNV